MNSENAKFNLFIGGIITVFLCSLLMALFLFLGAESIGVTLLWTGVTLSMAFNVITGFLGGSSRQIEEEA